MNWPMSDRDTTEFPDLELNVGMELREHLKGIISIPDGVDANDYTKFKELAFKGKSDQRIRTYRKLYERLGIVYRRDGKLYHSRLGKRISSLESDLNAVITAEIRDISEIIVNVLKRYQYVNPLDANPKDYISLPRVHPYFLLWKVMDGLGGKIHYQEINRVLLKVQSDSEAEKTILKISSAREKLLENFNDPQSLDNELGQRVITDQESARIAPLFSLAGWGGLLIDREPDRQGFRHFSEKTKDIISRALSTEPSFFETDDEDDWISYYFSDIAINDEIENSEALHVNPLEITASEIQARIERLGGHYNTSIVEQLHLGLTFHPDKHFVLLKGPSGTGKTLLVRTYSRALFNIVSLDIPLPNLFLCPVRPNWTDPSQVLGYYDVISGKYVVPSVLEAIFAAISNPEVPIIICFDEMNLSRIEYYFSDVLSAMESREEFELHSRGENVSCSQGKRIPEKIRLPDNLYIIGTINVDESTSPISEKVLDRAVIVDINVGGLADYLNFLEVKRPSIKDTIRELRGFLTTLDSILIDGGHGLNNRSVEEILLYLQRAKSSSNSRFGEHVDEVIKSKVLSKLKGDENIRDIVEKLREFFKSNTNYPELTSCLTLMDKLLFQLDDFGAFKAFR